DALQALVGHREDADLVDRAEPVLDRADETEARMRVAFEVEDGVDNVLEDARPGERAVLGDVADENDRRSARLGETRQLRSALAHLRDRARRGGQRFAVDGLDRVDDRDLRPLAFDRGEDLLEADLGEHAHRTGTDAEPARAQRHLRAALLAGDVERLHAAGERVERLQEQRRLADPGVAADQDDAAFDDAAAERAVELVDPGRMALGVTGVDLGERRDAFGWQEAARRSGIAPRR